MKICLIQYVLFVIMEETYYAVMAHVCALSMQKKEVAKTPTVIPLDTLRQKLTQ
jgi:hypothetical protein